VKPVASGQSSGAESQLTAAFIRASLPLALLFVKAMKVWGARPARVGIFLLAAAIIAAAAPFLEPGDNTSLWLLALSMGVVFLGVQQSLSTRLLSGVNVLMIMVWVFVVFGIGRRHKILSVAQTRDES
jgi:hypothetical protein